MGFDIANAAAMLNRQQTVISKEVSQQYRNKLVLENELKKVQCLTAYTSRTSSTTDFIQAYQHGHTPKGQVTFGEVTSYLQHMKVDILYTREELDELLDTYMVEVIQDGSPMKDWTFFKWLEMTEIHPAIQENHLDTAWKGVRQEPVAGTAGATINSVDGLGTVIDAKIADSTITPIAIGAFDPDTQVNRLETFVDGLPETVRDLAGNIYCSPSNAIAYERDKDAKFGRAAGSGELSNSLRIDWTNKKLVACPEMIGDDRFLFSPGNLIMGMKKGQGIRPTIRYQEFDRTLKGLSEFSRFYSVKHWEKVFISD